MKKIIFLSLIIALIGALVMPVISAPAPAEAAGTTMTCSPASLNFVVYEGVPTYLLGIIPLDSQKLTLTLSGSGISGWTVTDNAGWLNEGLLFGVLSSISSKTRTTQVGVSVNSKGLTAGTYTATITFKITTCGTKTITVPVTLEVRTPKVLGPLCIGLDKDLGKNLGGKPAFAAVNEYSGITARLLVNPDNIMDMQALQTNILNGGTWSMVLQRGEAYEDGTINVLGGTLKIEGVTSTITYGTIAPLSALLEMAAGMLPPELATADFGNTYVVLFGTSDDKSYAAIVLADLDKMLDIIPALGGMLSGGSSTTEASPSDITIDKTSPGTNNQQMPTTDMTIPLKPVFSLIGPLMPVLIDLLSNDTVLALLKPLAGAIPPIVIVMPMETLLDLFMGLAPQ